MEFAILGAVEVRRDDAPVPLGGPKQRAVLALLLLEANRPVSRDRLIDGVWGESPPASAGASLDSYVSRLRRLLGPERLERRPPGYALRVEPDELDLDRFEALVAKARAATDARERARLLREALAVWRGPPLADLQFEPFASIECARLEERRLDVLEQRIDAELESDGAGELVAELERLVREQPLRERLVGQLMLALYRSERQADALAVFASARRRLAEELGLAPGRELGRLERRILEHDPTLGAVRPPRAATASRGARRARPLVLVAGLAAVAAAAGAAAVTLKAGSPSDAPLAHADSSALVSVDAGSRDVHTVSTLPGTPVSLAAGFGSVWAADPIGGQVLRADERTGAVTDRIAVAAQPSALAVGGGAVWVASTVGGLLTRIDPRTDRSGQPIRLGGANPAALVFAGGNLWVADATDRSLVRIDAGTGEIRKSIPLGLAPTALASGGGELWAAGYDSGSVDEVDVASGQVVAELPVGQGPAAVAYAGGSLWVANSLDGTLTRIDPLTARTRATTPIGSGPTALAAGRGRLWVANEYSAGVSEVDLRSGAVRSRLRTGGRPASLGLADGRLWIGAAPSARAHRGGTLTLSETAHLTTVDPAFEDTAEPTQLPRLVYDTLVTFDNAPGAPGLRLVPDLALQLPQPVDGGRTYVFRLRPGIRYSDGRDVHASDFRRAMERLFRARAPGTVFYSSLAGAAACVRRPSACDLSRAVVTDDAARSVSFHLARHDPDFLYELTEFTYTAPVPRGTPSRDLRWRPLPGTGPYRIVAAGRDGVRLERNPYFREWSHAAQPDGNPDTVRWIFPRTHAREIAAIERGRADWTLDFIPIPQLRAIERSRPALLHANPAFIVEFLPLNTNIPPFDSVEVRRALNLAVDRRRIARLYGGRLVATPLCQPLPPGMPGYARYCPYTRSPSARGAYRGPDLPRARRLVAASGRAGARVVVWGTTDEAAIPPSLPAYLAHVLRRLGFRVTLRRVPLATLTIARRRSIQLSVDGDWLPDFPSPASYLPSFFGCHGPHSNGFVCDPRLDRLMRQATARDVSDPRGAARLWAAADRRITDRAYWVPTVNLREVDLVSSRLHNYEFNPVWGFLADQAWVR